MLHRHGMYLYPATSEVRTMQGWKDYYRKKVWNHIGHRGPFQETFEQWAFDDHGFQAVTVYLEHPP